MHLRRLTHAGLKPLPGGGTPDIQNQLSNSDRCFGTSDVVLKRSIQQIKLDRDKPKLVAISPVIIEWIKRREEAERQKRMPAQVPLYDELPDPRRYKRESEEGEERPNGEPNRRGVITFQL